MSDRVIGMRDTALLSVACAAGVVVAPQFPYVGLPVTAAAAAGLAYGGRTVASIGAALIGAALAAAVLPHSAAFAIPVSAAVLLAVWLLRTRSAQFVGLVLTLAIAGGAIAADALSARSVGQSLVEAMRAQAVTLTEGLRQALGPSAANLSDQLATLRPVLASLWPSFYVQSAIFVAVFVIVAIAWAARRSGVEIAVPAAKELDLSVHVVWPFVIGLVAVAAASLPGANTAVARAVGFNALYSVRTLFFIQGVAVVSALFDVPKSGHVKMVALYVVLWVLDQFLLIVSLVGMLDFWANFRRLPREASAKPISLEAPPGSI